MNRHFSIKEIKANKHVNRLTISLLIRKMQIKITRRYDFIPTRITIIKKIDNKQVLGGCRKIKPLHIAGGDAKKQPLWKTGNP